MKTWIWITITILLAGTAGVFAYLWYKEKKGHPCSCKNGGSASLPVEGNDGGTGASNAGIAGRTGSTCLQKNQNGVCIKWSQDGVVYTKD